MHSARVLWIACLAQLLIVLDASIVYIALPSIGDELSLTATGDSWLAMAYSLGFAGCLLAGARLSDRFAAARVIALDRLAAEDAGAASGLLNVSKQLGGAVGLAVLVAVSASSGSDAGAFLAMSLTMLIATGILVCGLAPSAAPFRLAKGSR